MDEEYTESVDTSADMDVSDVDVADDVSADIPDDVPEDDYSEVDVADDVSDDVIDETVDDAEFDEVDESIEEDSIEPEADEIDESMDDIEEDTLDESEDSSEDYEEVDDIPEDIDSFDEEQGDEFDDSGEIPEDTDNSEATEQEEAFNEDVPEDVTDTETTDETSDVEDTDTSDQPEDVTDVETTDETSDVEDTDTSEQPEDVADTEATAETSDVEDADTAEQPEDMADAETTDETSDVEDAATSDQSEDVTDTEATGETSDVEDADTSNQPEDVTDAEATDETSDVEDTDTSDQPEDVSDAEDGNHSDLETYDYETSPETQDAVNPETSGEYVSADNPYRENWEKFADELSDGKDESEGWDSLKDVPFAGDGSSDASKDSSVAETTEASEMPEINSISDYMNAHNYGPDDFATYSQDPQWRQLMRQEYPDYELPELSQESANAQLSQYMNDHNYGIDDYAEYSQDPVWRELHSTAFPNDELPPLTGEKEAAELTNLSDNEVSDVQQTMQEENDDVSISSAEDSVIDAEDETGEENISEYQEYKKSFFSKNNIERDYETYSISDAENLSDEEKRVLQDYTSENPKCSYSNINRSLYDPEFKAADEQEESMLENEINVLTDCLDNKELPRQAELYRGIKSASDIFGEDVNTMSPEEIIEKYTGTEYINPAFTSTSCSRDVAQKFANGAWGKDSGLLTIKAPKGTKGMCVGDISSFGSSEGEVLLQRGTIYRLDKIAYENGQYNITMTARGNAR